MNDTPPPKPFDAQGVAIEFVAAFKRACADANGDVKWCPKRLRYWLTRELQDTHDAGAEAMRKRAAGLMKREAESYADNYRAATDRTVKARALLVSDTFSVARLQITALPLTIETDPTEEQDKPTDGTTDTNSSDRPRP